MMNNKTVNKKKLLQVFLSTFFLTYGIHYFGYFVRVRYFNIIVSLAETNPGLYSILRYLGHLVFGLIFVIYCFSVEGEEKYFIEFLPGKRNNKISKLLVGMLIGFIMNFTCIFAAMLHGDITFSSTKSFDVGLFVLAFFAVLIQASQEEMESRVFFFNKLKEGGFSFEIAMLLSGVYFSFLHANNPSFGIIPFITIFLAGVVYVLIYIYTDSIWTTCGIHQFWNFTQDYIFGLPNSGNPSSMSIFTSVAKTNSFFYSIDFGVEGSLLCILIHAIVAIILIVLIKRKSSIVKN